jgi:hypothetical protein
MGTHTFSSAATDIEFIEARHAIARPIEDEDAETGFARVISRTSTEHISSPPSPIFKVPLRDDDESPVRQLSHSPPARTVKTSSSAMNVLRPMSINTHHNRINTACSALKLYRTSSIMDRGRPVRKSSGACWPGVGRELGTRPAEEWQIKKDNRDSTTDLHFR